MDLELQQIRDDRLRQVDPKWNKAMVVASIAISFLGTFTSTQLMCQARASFRYSSVFGWSLLGSLIFGFCSIWGLHEVAMLAYEFDIAIGVDLTLTVLSALLAVSFTFLAVAGDLLFDRYRSGRHGRHGQRVRRSQGRRKARDHVYSSHEISSSAPLLPLHGGDEESIQTMDHAVNVNSGEREPSIPASGLSSTGSVAAFTRPSLKTSYLPLSSNSLRSVTQNPLAPSDAADDDDDDDDDSETHQSTQTSSITSSYRRYSASDSNSGSYGIRHAVGLIRRDTRAPTMNIFLSTIELLYTGLTYRNILKGLIWSLAITSMHYVGIFALKVPNGYYKFNTGLLILSALISWIVCTVGFILMSKMETHLPSQVVFSVIATAGVAAMHFTGMSATTFWSTEPASDVRGFPPALASSVVGVAFVTCMVANVLLSHAATLSRNKLAEIVWTRKELFKNIAAKEHAEAAARARSEFIASASHEIRTPLHHLQGYSDLLAQTELSDDGRSLLTAIQRATKTLSLLTNNVLDWSKFEGNTDGDYRPTSVDIRSVCESITTLMPNLDEDSKVDIYVVVSPQVPKTLSLDESWFHRILMNLVSNALKFTKHGYILLALDVQNGNLIATVEDTGCGLDPNFIPEMWTPFKQGEVRGSARGTGLGLSIIQQLLQRMNGSIEVESQYQHTPGVGPEKSGTKFVVTIPIGRPDSPPQLISDEERAKVAVLADDARSIEGLSTAWKAFDCEVAVVNSVSQLRQSNWKYVWAELDFLANNKELWPQLLQTDHLILIAYDTQDTLDSLPGILKARNIVLLQKPLLWHTFAKRISLSRDRRRPLALSQALRFAPEVEVLNEVKAEGSMEDSMFAAAQKREYTILLVEDNPINRKLGTKMLQALKYKILLANDGLESLDMVAKHDTDIDCILMDQSMPNMDGVTATRMIRSMEQQGKLRSGRPILAVTAVVNSESREQFRQAGADDFLAKPLSIERLKDVLRVYLPES